MACVSPTFDWASRMAAIPRDRTRRQSACALHPRHARAFIAALRAGAPKSDRNELRASLLRRLPAVLPTFHHIRRGAPATTAMRSPMKHPVPKRNARPPCHAKSGNSAGPSNPASRGPAGPPYASSELGSIPARKNSRSSRIIQAIFFLLCCGPYRSVVMVDVPIPPAQCRQDPG